MYGWMDGWIYTKSTHLVASVRRLCLSILVYLDFTCSVYLFFFFFFFSFKPRNKRSKSYAANPPFI